MAIQAPVRRVHHPQIPLIAFAAIGAVLAVLVAAVGYSAISSLGPRSSPPIAVVSPSPTTTPSPSPAVTPTPAPTPTPVSVVAGLHGRLAISSGQTGSGGWIQFPGGKFTADPTSSVSLGYGGWANGLAWNAATRSWVPVNWYLIRQDGRLFAYLTYSYGQAVAVHFSDGSIKQLATLPGAISYAILSAEPQGVYVTTTQGQGGLWRVDYSGGVHTISPTGFWQAAAFGYGWGTVTSSVPKGGTNVIRRIDLSTGGMTDWFRVEGMQSRVVGLTLNGAPIIEASNDATAQVWLASAPAKLLHTEKLEPSITKPPYYGYMQQTPVYVITALGDDFGVWVATESGLYLYSETAGWEFASTTTGQLASNLQR